MNVSESVSESESESQSVRTCVRVSFFNNAAGLKKEILVQVKFCEFYKNKFIYRSLQVAVFVNSLYRSMLLVCPLPIIALTCRCSNK